MIITIITIIITIITTMAGAILTAEMVEIKELKHYQF
jgi:hypothetical protein